MVQLSQVKDKVKGFRDHIKGALLTTQSDAISEKVSVYFDIIQEHSISLTSQITDNWMENNTVINDHIANSPLVVNLRGLSGELVYEPSITEESTLALTHGGVLTRLYEKINGRIGNIGLQSEKLTDIASLFPPVDNITQAAKNAISYVEASVNRYSKVVKDFLTPGIQRATRLQQIFRDLSTLRENKTALIVYTPYESFDNMYIQTITLRQGNEKYITDIELTLKQCNFTDTLTTTANEEVLAKYNQFQRAGVENHGKVQGPRKSLAAQIYDGDKITLLGE